MARVTIRYCHRCSYRPRAEAAAGAVQRSLGVTPELVVGNPGEFSVWVDSRLVAEKESGGFPSEEALVQAVRAGLS